MYDAHVVEEHDPQFGYTLKIVLDPEPFHPYEDDEGKLSTFVFDHGRYTLGDTTLRQYLSDHPEHMNEVGGLDQQMIGHDKRVLAFEWVEMLDHSGLRFYLKRDADSGAALVLHRGWDTGIIGFAIVTREDFERVGLDPDAPDAREKAQQNIRSEVSVLDQYHSGQVYGYQITDLDGDIVDDGYGFYREPDRSAEEAAEAEGKSSLSEFVKREEAHRAQMKDRAFVLGA